MDLGNLVQPQGWEVRCEWPNWDSSSLGVYLFLGDRSWKNEQNYSLEDLVLEDLVLEDLVLEGLVLEGLADSEGLEGLADFEGLLGVLSTVVEGLFYFVLNLTAYVHWLLCLAQKVAAHCFR